MATNAYMDGRTRYTRPQGMLWSDTPATLLDNKYVPSGYEQYSNISGLTNEDVANSFLVLSDHNRAAIDITPERIQQRKRMINGTMRTYYNSDKLNISTSWSMLPSRGFANRPDFNQSTGLSVDSNTLLEYTADGGAGGAEMVRWYEDHVGPFWVFLAYDKHTNFGEDSASRLHLPEYNQVIQMSISNFDYSVVKRGRTNFDLWNISVSLEEV